MSENPLANMGNLLKQAHAMQAKLGKLQAEADAKTVQASAGGGMVTVTATGGMRIAKVEIDPEVLKAEDRDLLQDLLAAATNEALRKAKDIMAEEMKGLTGGLGLPGIL